jgi:hypothetical protein
MILLYEKGQARGEVVGGGRGNEGLKNEGKTKRDDRRRK